MNNVKSFKSSSDFVVIELDEVGVDDVEVGDFPIESTGCDDALEMVEEGDDGVVVVVSEVVSVVVVPVELADENPSQLGSFILYNNFLSPFNSLFALYTWKCLLRYMSETIVRV